MPTSRLLALLPILVLLGCPPNRGNVPDANETGGAYGQAVLNYRYFASYDVYTVFLMLPREDDYGCENSSGYGWYDDDSDWLSVGFFRGGEVDWTGEYPPYYSGDCDFLETYAYEVAHCTQTLSGTDPEGASVSQDAWLDITSWSEAQVRGSIEHPGGTRESFRATNCGELPAYYYDGRSEQARPEGQPMGRPEDPVGPVSWSLRFR